MQQHPRRTDFTTAAYKEYRDLAQRDTFDVIQQSNGRKMLPVIWVFIYKFDMNGYLAKCKAQLYV